MDISEVNLPRLGVQAGVGRAREVILAQPGERQPSKGVPTVLKRRAGGAPADEPGDGGGGLCLALSGEAAEGGVSVAAHGRCHRGGHGDAHSRAHEGAGRVIGVAARHEQDGRVVRRGSLAVDSERGEAQLEEELRHRHEEQPIAAPEPSELHARVVVLGAAAALAEVIGDDRAEARCIDEPAERQQKGERVIVVREHADQAWDHDRARHDEECFHEAEDTGRDRRRRLLVGPHRQQEQRAARWPRQHAEKRR